MSELIRIVNTADRLAGLWRAGQMTAVALAEALANDGWYRIRIGDDVPGLATAYLNGVRYRLGEA